MTCIGFALGLVVLHCPDVQPIAPPAVGRFCALGQLVRYSRHDTAETRRQLRVANARYRAACGDR